MGARRRRHRRPWLEAGERLSEVPLGRLQRGAPAVCPGAGLADVSHCSKAGYTGVDPPYQWRTSYGHDYLYAGPLFTHQLSHLWIDFRGIQDAYMHKRGIDYFENSRRATYVQRDYAIDNPLNSPATATRAGGSRPATDLAPLPSGSTASNASSSTTWAAGCRMDRTTAPSRRGPWWPRYHLRPRSSCRRSAITSIRSGWRRTICTASKPPSTRPTRTRPAPPMAGSRPGISGSTKVPSS